MSTREALLSLLEPAPAYGYTLKQDYDRWFGRRRPMAFGQVYATLASLEKQGLADLASVEEGQGPQRRLYEITDAGVQAVDDWVWSPDPPDQFASSSLCARLTAALLSGRDPVRVVAAQREVHLTRMRELQAQRRHARGPEVLSATYELAHLDADLRWLDQSRQRIAEAAADLVQQASNLQASNKQDMNEQDMHAKANDDRRHHA